MKYMKTFFKAWGKKKNPLNTVNFTTSAAAFNCKNTFDHFSLVYIEPYNCFSVESPKHMNVYIRDLGKQARQVF